MSRDGNGNYSLPALNPVVTSTTISSTWANNTMNDVAAALTASIASDGQTTPSADLKMGTFKHKNVGNATSRISTNANYASAADVQDGTITHLTGTAGTNTITASAPLGLAAYVTGQRFYFIPAATNTGATTLNINSIGAKNIFLNSVALAGGELLISAPVELIYDGTQFHIIGNSAFVAVTDSSAIVKGSSDATKKVRFEVDGFTTATTRVITPPDMNVSLVSMTVKRKTADESVTTSTVLQDDDHLLFAIAANEEWVASIDLDVGTNVAAHGAKFAITVPAGATLNATATGIGTTSANSYATESQTSGGALTLPAAAFAGAGGMVASLQVWVLNGATPGNVTLQWAQATSSGTMTIKKGSALVAHRIA